jgi:hypothetical protein
MRRRAEFTMPDEMFLKFSQCTPRGRKIQPILTSIVLTMSVLSSIVNAQTRPTTPTSRPTPTLTAPDFAGLFKVAATTLNGEGSLEELGKLQARVGDFAGAEATAKKIQGWGLAHVTGRVVAYRAATQGATATTELLRLGLDAGDEQVLDEVVMVLSETGNFAEARNVARLLPRGVYAAVAWLTIARSSRQQTDLEQAMGNFREPPDGVNFGQAVEARAACGDVTGAMKQAEAAKGAGDRPEALWRIARVQARAGDFAAAKATAERIGAKDNMLESDQAWTCIATALAAKGDVAGTKAAIERVQWGLRKPQVTSVLAYAQAKAGDLAGAKQTAAQLVATGRTNEDSAACFAYGLIAAALAERGDTPGARAMLAQAETTISTFQSRDAKVDGILLAMKGALLGPCAVETEGYPNAE